MSTAQLTLDFDRAGAAPGAEGSARVVALSAYREKVRAIEEGLTRQGTADACFERGEALEQEAPAEAIASYREALRHWPRHADAHVNLGRLLQVLGRPVEAEQHYRAALEARPDDAIAAFNLGTALEDQGLLEPAIAAYGRALSLDPTLADAHYNLALLYERTGRAVAALRHLTTYRKVRSR